MTRTIKVLNNNNERKKTKCSDSFALIFSDRLKKARENKGLTQEQISEKLKIGIRTYQHYEATSPSNVRIPNLETIVEICSLLDCDITYLTGENKENIYKKDTASAAEVTGLEYNAIKKLEEIKRNTDDISGYSSKKQIDVLSDLITHNNFQKLSYEIWNCTTSFYETVSYQDFFSESERTILKHDLCKHTASDAISEILRDLHQKYSDTYTEKSKPSIEKLRNTLSKIGISSGYKKMFDTVKNNFSTK